MPSLLTNKDLLMSVKNTFLHYEDDRFLTLI